MMPKIKKAKEVIETSENISIAITNPDGAISGFYTTEVPKLKIEGDSAVKELTVTVSASEAEDTALLHELLTEMRRSEKSEEVKKTAKNKNTVKRGRKL